MKLFLILLIVTLLSNSLISQARFTIEIESFKWDNITTSKVDLTIYIKITNEGNEKGKCEDLKGLYLDCALPYYYFEITYKDNGRNILNNISPGNYLESWITFTVPKNADDLSLKLMESYGGGSKYVTKSYSKCIADEKSSEYYDAVIEGDRYFDNKDYQSALTSYLRAREKDYSKAYFVNEKIRSCYIEIGDDYYSKTVYSFALENYKYALIIEQSEDIKEKVANIYKLLGDELLTKSLIEEALNDYKWSLIYSENSELRAKERKLEKEVNIQKQKDKILEEEHSTDREDYSEIPNKASFLLEAGYLISSFELTNQIPSEIENRNGFLASCSYLFNDIWSIKFSYQSNNFGYLNKNYQVNMIKADLIVRTSSSNFHAVFGLFGLGFAMSELIYNSYLDSLNYVSSGIKSVTLGNSTTYPVISFSGGLEYRLLNRLSLELNIPFDLVFINQDAEFLIASPILSISFNF